MIHITKNSNITKILIENGASQKDSDKLLDLLKTEKKLEISFISTYIVSPIIVKELNYYNDKLELNTNNKTLWNYLKKFSINIKFNRIYHPHCEKNTEIKAIGIGGSAGALTKIIEIIKELPYADISVFIVIHILPNEKNNLATILQQYTKYIVKEATNGEKIKTNHIYIASPDLHMTISDDYIYQSSKERVNFSRPSIDVLFKSISDYYKESLITILTCGYLSDGTKSLKELQENGSISIIQDPKECEADEIPLNAIATGNQNYIYNLDHINEYIKLKLNAIFNIEDRVSALLETINSVYGYDFRHYDLKSIIRRIELLKVELGITNFIELEHSIICDNQIFKLLLKKLSINVSDFFRDPLIFKQLRDEVVPVLKTYPHIKVWCSACSGGEEPYSVAILLDEMGLLDRSIIYATDFNNEILEQAKNGLFPKNNFNNYKKNYTQSGGKENFDNYFEIYNNYVEVNSRIKEKLHFFQHNLATDGVFNEFHLIFCRNVLIYFDKDLQNKVIKLMDNSLERKCFLVLGESETVSFKDGFVKINENKSYKIYKKLGE